MYLRKLFALVAVLVGSVNNEALAQAGFSAESICKAPTSRATERFLDVVGSGDNAIKLGSFITSTSAADGTAMLPVSCQTVEEGGLPVYLANSIADGVPSDAISAKKIAEACGASIAVRSLLSWPNEIFSIDNSSKIEFGFADANGPCSSLSTSEGSKALCKSITGQRQQLEGLAGIVNAVDRDYWLAASRTLQTSQESLDSSYDRLKASSGRFEGIVAGINRLLLSSGAEIQCSPSDIPTLVGQSTDEIHIAEKPDSSDQDERSHKPKIVIAKNLSGLRAEGPIAINDRTKSSYAELSATVNNEEREDIKDENGDVIGKRPAEAVSFEGAIGRSYFITNEGGPDILITPYAALAYKENEDPSKETDNLSAGVEAAFHLNDDHMNWFGPTMTPRIQAAYITDIEERESQQYYVALTTDLPFAERMRDLPVPIINTYGADTTLFEFGKLDLSFGWDLDAVIDYSDVADSGDKLNLFDYARTGLDWNGTFKLSPGREPNQDSDEKWSLALDLDYKVRDVFDGQARNANFVEIGLSYKPPKTSNLSYGITYREGQNILSLEDLENWEVSLKVRR